MISGLTPKPKKISSSHNESFVMTTNEPLLRDSEYTSRLGEFDHLPFTGNAHIRMNNQIEKTVPLNSVHSTKISRNTNNRSKIPIKVNEIYDVNIQIGSERIKFRDYTYLEQKRLLYLQQLYNSLLNQESQLLIQQSSLTNNSIPVNELKTENQQIVLQENGFNKQYILECVRHIKYGHNNNNHSDRVIGMLLLSKEGHCQKGHQDTLKESQHDFGTIGFGRRRDQNERIRTRESQRRASKTTFD